MNADEPTPEEDALAARAAELDDALAAGQALTLPLDGFLSEAERPRLQRVLGCLKRLERVWPRHANSAETPPACPLCGSLAGAGRILTAAPAPRAVHGYEILGELGRGGMGVVYRARQVSLNRLVALKMIAAGSWASPQELARFRAEAEAVAQLRHPNIVQIYEIGEAAGQPFFSLEYLEGGTLAQRLDGSPLPPREAARLLRDLARAVHYAHQNGILHRDLKPANILLETHGLQPVGLSVAKIADFGLAKRLGGSDGQTKTGAILGTPSYMAPEQAAGQSGQLGPATDVYALGAILYELLTGRPPFRASTPLDTMMQVVAEDPVPPSRFQPKLLRNLETICLTCLQKSPRKRYGSAEALARDLDRFLEDRPIAARRAGVLERSYLLVRRYPLAAALTGAVATLLLLLAVGGSLSALWLRQERDGALDNLDRAEKAEKQAKEDLWNSYLQQARANRLSGQFGQRFDSLEAVRKAAAIRPSLELRNEAIACLVLADLRRGKQWAVRSKHAFAFDASLTHYAYGDDRGNLCIHRTADGRELARLPGPGNPAWVVHFSPDGRFLAAKHHPAGQNHLVQFYLWDWAAGKTIWKATAGEFGYAMGFRCDSGQLAVAARDGAIILFDPLSGREVKRLPAGPMPSWIGYRPGHHQLAVSSLQEAAIRLHDVDAGSMEKFSLPAVVRGLSWRGDGRLLAAACANYRIPVWDIVERRQVADLEGHQAEVIHLAFNRRGNLLASTAWDNTVRLWDPLGKRLLASGPGFAAWLGFSPDDRTLAGCGDGSQLATWEVADGQACRALHGHQGPGKGPSAVDFSPDGRWLASIKASDGLRLWNAETGREVAFAPVGQGLHVCFDSTGDALLTSGSAGLQRWPLSRDSASNLPHLGPAESLDPGPDWGQLAHSRDGRTCALVGNGCAHVLGFGRGGPAKRLAILDHPGIAYVAVSPDGRWAATAPWHASGVRVWDLKNGKQVRELPGRDPFVAFSPDGRWLATGTPSDYCFWQVGTWEKHHVLTRAREDNSPRLAFDPTGRFMAIAHAARTIRLIDLDTWQETATLSTPQPQPICWMCFSPRGDRLAVAVLDGVVQLWNLRYIQEQLTALRLGW